MKFTAIPLFVLFASLCPASDLNTELVILRTDFDLEALSQSTAKEALSFRVYVQPSLSTRRYAIDGKLKLPKTGESSGSLTLVEADGAERKSRTFSLTHSQTREVYAWFSEAKFLDPKVAESLNIPVLDGIDIIVEGYADGRYFRLRRNAADSATSERFYRRIDAFLIWKEEPNQ